MSQPTPDQLLDGRRATRAYADLMFAFGFARLGDSATAEQLRADAGTELDAIPTHGEFHRLARTAFECRTAEALRGEPHTGTLDDRCPEVIAMHFAVVDPLVLAVVGTGPLSPEAELPERLALLHSVRTPVLAWIDGIPVTKD